ncbi:hypothetical protein IWZ01DRAFT_174909 [Phyllosticta capitalensis]
MFALTCAIQESARYRAKTVQVCAACGRLSRIHFHLSQTQSHSSSSTPLSAYTGFFPLQPAISHSSPSRFLMSSTEPTTPAGEDTGVQSSPLSSVISNLSNLNLDNEEHENEEHENEEQDNEEHDNEEHDNEEHDNEEHDNEEHDNDTSSSSDEDDISQALGASTSLHPDSGLPRLLESASLNDTLKTCIATEFAPPSSLSPDKVFEARTVDLPNGSVERFTLRDRHVPALGAAKTIAIYISGDAECSNFRQIGEIPRPIGDMTRPGNVAKVYVRREKGGCAFIYKPGQAGTKSLALEREGPDGKTHKRTETRAELRAVLAALHYKDWHSEGWKRVVLITSCMYVADHATTSLPMWWERDWFNKNGHPIKNQDLWKELSRVICDFEKHGCEVCFWRVPEDKNVDACKAAKDAVADPEGEGFAM